MTDEERPRALEAYERLADAYAERAPTKPFNADLERPETRELLPDLDGKRVLDAGCGPGITTAELLAAGTEVVGLDVSPAMLRHAWGRIDGDASLLRADLGGPLPFPDGSFDVVHGSLAFDYVRDWTPLFGELARILRADGTLVCSVGHPFADATFFDPEDYFAVEAVSAVWEDFGDPVEVPTYRRPLETALNPLLEAGFRLDRVSEATPTGGFREKSPETYERVSREPTSLCLRATLR
ncbi:class I SAM-dependent methyltransferase [Halorarum halobium]|uniref:class I SAM-dependent methyltransferase n=1 Tax=Halorarum halobium TaxID=3075121 RepID=UPI0028AF7460|nr:class I SAM-dependent methyltransferase [Halobaculum sp. XH14]